MTSAGDGPGIGRPALSFFSAPRLLIAVWNRANGTGPAFQKRTLQRHGPEILCMRNTSPFAPYARREHLHLFGIDATLGGAIAPLHHCRYFFLVIHDNRSAGGDG